MNVLEIISRYEEILKQKGIPKSKFYAKCGISSSAVSQWRKGKTKPSVDTLNKIASELGISYNYLVTGEKSPLIAMDHIDIDTVAAAIVKASGLIEKEQKANEQPISSSEKEVIELFRKLPDSKKETALEVIKAIALASGAIEK